MEEPLHIRRRNRDHYQVISIRLPENLSQKVDEIAEKTNRSRNAIINLILEYGIQNIEILPK